MPIDPVARTHRSGYEKPYEHERLKDRLRELPARENESMREASLRSGLDHQAVRRIITG